MRNSSLGASNRQIPWMKASSSYTAIKLRRQQQSSKNCLLSSLVGVAALVDSCPCVPSVSVPSLAGLAVLRGLSCATPGTIQYCFKMLTSPCNALKTEEFCDLCSVANISVMMFDYTYGGYYIHGRSPSGFTEVSAEKLRHQLLFESYGKSNMRGITYEDPEL